MFVTGIPHDNICRLCGRVVNVVNKDLFCTYMLLVHGFGF